MTHWIPVCRSMGELEIREDVTVKAAGMRGMSVMWCYWCRQPGAQKQPAVDRKWTRPCSEDGSNTAGTPRNPGEHGLRRTSSQRRKVN